MVVRLKSPVTAANNMVIVSSFPIAQSVYNYFVINGICEAFPVY